MLQDQIKELADPYGRMRRNRNQSAFTEDVVGGRKMLSAQTILPTQVNDDAT